MKQWMLALLVAGASATTSVQAANACNTSCDPCNYTDPCSTSCSDCIDLCSGSIEIYGAPLYMRPSVCDLNYVINDSRDFTQASNFGIGAPIGRESGICPDYQWGFRLGVGYVMDSGCKDARVTYTRLHSKDHSSMSTSFGNALWPTWGYPQNLTTPLVNLADNASYVNGISAVAQERVRIDWDAIDAEVATRSMKGSDLWLRSHIGLHWAELQVRRSASYAGSMAVNTTLPTAVTNTFSSVSSNSKTWGIGPRAGVDLRYDVFCGFGVGAHANMALLAGEAKAKFSEQDTLTAESQAGSVPTMVVDVPHKSRCVVFPEFDAALGINYMFCCGDCFNLFMELGYEFRTYLNSLHRTTWASGGGLNHEGCSSINFDGLYLDLRVTF